MKTLKEKNVFYFSGSCIYWGFLFYFFKLEDKSLRKTKKWQHVLEKEA